MKNTEDPEVKYNLRLITVPHCGNCRFYDEGEFPEDPGQCLNDLMRDDSRIAAFPRCDEVCDLYEKNGEEDQEDDNAPRVSLKIAPCEMVEPQKERKVTPEEEGMRWLRNNGFDDLPPLQSKRLFSGPFILNDQYIVIIAWPFITSDGEVFEWYVTINGLSFSGDTPREALTKAFENQNYSFENIKKECVTKESIEEFKKAVRRSVRGGEGSCETCKYASRASHGLILYCHNEVVKKWHRTTDTAAWIVCDLYESNKQ